MKRGNAYLLYTIYVLLFLLIIVAVCTWPKKCKEENYCVKVDPFDGGCSCDGGNTIFS